MPHLELTSIMNREEKIRKRIKLTRLEKGFTQDYVGRQLHMSQVSYQKLENGKTSLKVSTLLDLAKVLKVKASYFIDIED